MQFYYKAKKITGEETEGTKEVSDEFELAKILKEENYILTYFSQNKSGAGGIMSFLTFIKNIFLFEKISVSEKMIFSRNLAVMIDAGFSLSRAIDTLSKQTINKKFKKTLKLISEEIKKGKTFNESLANYPKIFSCVFIAMIKSGEKTGNLSDSLKILGIQLKREYELKKRIKGALIYPAIIIIVMIMVGILMMIYIVPNIVSVFQELNTELPLSTKFFIKLSDLIINKGIYTLSALAVFMLVIAYFSKTSEFKKISSFIFLRLPLISGLLKKSNTAVTARTLGSLIGSGVNILEALDVTKDVLQNFYYKEVMKEAREKIEKGEQMSKVFSAHPRLYPEIMSEMTAVGEETGKISDMLLRIASFYEHEVAAQTKDLSTVIEPVLMIIVGTAVGFFAVSMLQPMYSMMQNV